MEASTAFQTPQPHRTQSTKIHLMLNPGPELMPGLSLNHSHNRSLLVMNTRVAQSTTLLPASPTHTLSLLKALRHKSPFHGPLTALDEKCVFRIRYERLLQHQDQFADAKPSTGAIPKSSTRRPLVPELQNTTEPRTFWGLLNSEQQHYKRGGRAVRAPDAAVEGDHAVVISCKVNSS